MIAAETVWFDCKPSHPYSGKWKQQSDEEAIHQWRNMALGSEIGGVYSDVLARTVWLRRFRLVKDDLRNAVCRIWRDIRENPVWTGRTVTFSKRRCKGCVDFKTIFRSSLGCTFRSEPVSVFQISFFKNSIFSSSFFYNVDYVGIARLRWQKCCYSCHVTCYVTCQVTC